jgi:hypothetical protein
MSAGHDHAVQGPGGVALEDLLTKPVYERLRAPVKENNDYDVPYLASYSKDGHTIYFDRHLPQRITIPVQHKVHTFDPRQFIRLHEELEKALIDLYDFSYVQAHRAALAYERRGLVRAYGPAAWHPYDAALRPFIKAFEHEKLVKVPPDLDMTPYVSSPVNAALIRAMRKAQGKLEKKDKDSVEYSGTGHKDSHCGPVKEWPGGVCTHFEKPRSCDKVEGVISPRGWCRLWMGVK